MSALKSAFANVSRTRSGRGGEHGGCPRDGAARPRFLRRRTIRGTLPLSRARAREPLTLRNGGGARAPRRDHRAEATRVQLLAGASAASAAIAIGGCDAHETVSAFVSLSMLRKTAPPPTRARKARARSLRTEEGPQTMGRGTPAGGGSGFAHVRRRPPGLRSLFPAGADLVLAVLPSLTEKTTFKRLGFAVCG